MVAGIEWDVTYVGVGNLNLHNPMKISKNYVTVVPAYGRDYKNKADATKDFVDGKDFQIQHFNYPQTYCSIHDFEKGVKVELRYKAKQSVTIVTV